MERGPQSPPSCEGGYNILFQMSFSLQNDHHAHDSKHDRLQPRMLAEHDGNIPDRRHISADATNDIFFSIQIDLSARVEFSVIGDVVVTFRQELWRRGRQVATGDFG